MDGLYDELIETLWNVNGGCEGKRIHFSNELIETLWNVNDTAPVTNVGQVPRINRNIVECK